MTSDFCQAQLTKIFPSSLDSYVPPKKDSAFELVLKKWKELSVKIKVKEEFIPDCISKQSLLDVSAENIKFPLTLEVNHYICFFKTVTI